MTGGDWGYTQRAVDTSMVDAIVRYGRRVRPQVRLGHTRVLAAVSAELGTPFPDRPTEGALNFLVECPPMGHGGWDVGGKPPDEAAEITRLLERTLRDTGAVDTEALCVLAGRSVRASHPQPFAPLLGVFRVDGAFG